MAEKIEACAACERELWEDEDLYALCFRAVYAFYNAVCIVIRIGDFYHRSRRGDFNESVFHQNLILSLM